MKDAFYRRVYEMVQFVRGEKVFEVLKKMETSQWLNLEAVREFQFQRLKKLVSHAYQHVPFYHERFDRAGIRPYLIKDWADFQGLPVLTKGDLRSQHKRLVAADRRYSASLYSSSGSTGPSSMVFVDKHAAAHRHAAVALAYRWMGSNVGTGVMQFWGTQLDAANITKERLRDILLHRVTIPTHLLDEVHLKKCYKKLTRFKPSVLYGFTSAIYEFACFLERRKLPIDRMSVKSILVTGEPLFPHQRECLERVFRCRVFVQYGAEEFGPIAYECIEGSLHIMAENVYVEREPALSNIGKGRLLMTSLNNFVMPLIRYEMGDVGVLSTDTCVCGRGLPVLKEISGRSVDFVRTPAGRLLHGINFDYLPKYFLKEIRQFQIIQTTADAIYVNLIKDAGFTDQTLTSFESRLRGIIGNEMKIVFEFKNEIPREKSGKTQFVKTLLK